MPRLQQHQMYGLLLVLAALLLPHMLRMPWWLAGMIAALFAWRTWLIRSQGNMPSHWILLPITFGLIGGVAYAFHSLTGKSGGVALLAVLVAAKSLEIRTRSDALLLVYLGYFLITTNFLFDQSMIMAVYLFAMVLLVTTLLIGWHSSIGLESWRQGVKQARLALMLMLQALPVMVLLFIFFPRIDGPLWRLPQERATTRPGLADAMAPGSFSSMAEDDSVAFRVSFEGARPQQDTLYWRGPVFEDFDGTTWTQTSPDTRDIPVIEPLDTKRAHYSITLEPHMRPWLLGLDMPISAEGDARLTNRLQLISSKPVDHRIRVNAVAAVNYRVGVDEKPEVLKRNLVLPKQGNERARQKAEEWRNLPPQQRIDEGLRFFARQGLLYKLNPPLYKENSVDQFVFEGKSGFCEHFASAFAFMMRAAGMPARVVGGYQGGDQNGDYLIIVQADAHAWTEVWMDGKGWVRVDPTFAVAPARIQEGLASALPQEDLPYLMRSDDNWVKRVRLMMDSAVNTWNQWVIGYSPQRQRDVLRRLGITDLLSWNFIISFVGALALLAAMSAALLLWRLRPVRPDKARILWDKFCTKLARRGLLVHAAEGPRDFAERAATALPARAAEIRSVVDAYLAVRYGEGSDIATLQQLVRRYRN